MQESMALFTALNIFTEPLELQQDITSLVSLSSDYSYTERLNFKKKKLWNYILTCQYNTMSSIIAYLTPYFSNSPININASIYITFGNLSPETLACSGNATTTVPLLIFALVTPDISPISISSNRAVLAFLSTIFRLPIDAVTSTPLWNQVFISVWLGVFLWFLILRKM